MKKILLTIALCCAPVVTFAAQTPVTQIEKFNSAATKIDDVRVATNVRLAAAQSNFTELYTLLGGNPWLAQTTAPSIHNVFWLDTTGAPPTIKYWDGDSWEVAAVNKSPPLQIMGLAIVQIAPDMVRVIIAHQPVARFSFSHREIT